MDPASLGRFVRLYQLRESFAEWHRVGVAGAKRGDVASTRDAIRYQAEIIRELNQLVRLRPVAPTFIVKAQGQPTALLVVF